jgi:hypothetical protein
VCCVSRRAGQRRRRSAGGTGEFWGSLGRFRAAKGLSIATSRLSKSARDTAEALSKRIVLTDGDQLAPRMIRHNVGEDILQLKKVMGIFSLIGILGGSAVLRPAGTRSSVRAPVDRIVHSDIAEISRIAASAFLFVINQSGRWMNRPNRTKPIGIEGRNKRVPDGAGGLVDRPTKFR